MKISAVMTTVDRGECNYIFRTISGLKERGFFNYPDLRLTVFDSGSESTQFLEELDLTGLPVSIEYSRDRLSFNQNFLRALRWGAGSGADCVISMEDDIEVVPDFAARVAECVGRDAKRTRVWSFHCPYGAVRNAVAAGLDHWDLQCPGYYGTQCLAMRARDAESFSQWLHRRLSGPEPVDPADLEINWWLLRTSGADHVRFSVPSLVQHIGERSSVRGADEPFVNTNDTFRMNFAWPDECRIPILKDGVRMQIAAPGYVLHADDPGKAVKIDASALAIVLSCTGSVSAGWIVDTLSRRFEVPRIVMREDVRAVLEQMEDFGFIRWNPIVSRDPLPSAESRCLPKLV